MSHKIYIGIDNGVTGTIAWMGEGVNADMIETPVKSEQSYTKEKNNITRIDYPEVVKRLKEVINHLDRPSEALVVMERPMIDPTRFQASLSAARSLEATLIAIESLRIPRMYVDSRQWQKALLPHGCKGPELKQASADIGCRLFPDRESIIRKHKDADALLIAEWARREGL